MKDGELFYTFKLLSVNWIFNYICILFWFKKLKSSLFKEEAYSKIAGK